METNLCIQGRSLSPRDIRSIRRLITQNPGWSRWKLSRELCGIWDWRNAKGQLKDIACRSLLRKLDERRYITLPPPVCPSPHRNGKRHIPDIEHSSDPISGTLVDLHPIQLLDARSSPSHEQLFHCLLKRYHYLSFSFPIGENLKYLAFAADGRPLACFLFGAPAWKAKDRDDYIGWSPTQRQRNLQKITNNTRFLVLPWVNVKCLASHLLSLAVKRLTRDWLERYGHPIYLVESFVDQSRFTGVCYQAANWRKVGTTVGRTRQDRYSSIHVASKDIYIYPLDKRFTRELTQ